MDNIWQRDEIDSPCVSLCVFHPESGLCIGCFRTGDEIAGWGLMAPSDRLSLMEALPARASQITGGRRKARIRRG